MRRFLTATSVLLGVVVALALTGSALADRDDDKHEDKPATANSRIFQAVLTGRGEVPPTTSDGLGLASYLLSRDGATLYYSLQVTGATSAVSAAHIHLGRRGQNGDVVANLCTSCGTEGVIASGSITAASLVGPLAGHSLNDLLSALRSSGAYTNVHTTTFPNGELRGQVVPLGAVAQAARDKHDDDDHHGHDDSDDDS